MRFKTPMSNLVTFLPSCLQKCIENMAHYVQVNIYKMRTGAANTAQRAVIIQKRD